MSVAIVGPQGYEYQYLVSIYFCLKYLNNSSIREVYIERMNKEDLFLQLQQGSDTKRVEVQFKKTTRTITMPLFAEWLCHFENKSSDANLLSRLQKDDSLTMFIVSSGRVNESVDDLKILAGHDLSKKQNEQATKTALDDLIDSIGKLYSDADKGLKKKQHEFVKEQAGKLKTSIKDLRQVLDRCAFIEKYDEDTAKLQIGVLLKKQFGIADSMHRRVILELLERVRQGRDKGSNILEAIKQTLLEFTRAIPQVPADYVEREIETKITSQLGSANLALLSGISFCGKSVTAKNIVKNLILKTGIESLHTPSIEAAAAFLNAPVTDERICLLEDPLGHTFVPGSYDKLKALDELVKNLPVHTKRILIVTSNSKLLQHFSLPSSLSNWIDLTMKDRSEIRKIWDSITDNGRAVPPNINETVIECIAHDKEDKLFQPGHLAHLKSNLDKLTANTKTAIKQLAFSNADKVKDEVLSKGSHAVLLYQVLTVSTDTVRGVSLDDLRYMLGSSKDYFPGIAQRKANRFSLRSEDQKQIDIPKYKDLPELGEHFSDFLIYLEENDYVRNHNNEFVFTHPEYLEAGHLLLKSNSTLQFVKTTYYLKKGIASLSYNLSINAVYACSFLLSAKTGNLNPKLITDILFDGLAAVFPTVSSLCFDALFQFYSLLSQEDAVKLNKLVERQGQYHDYVWHNGIAYKKPETSIYHSFDGEFRFIKEEEKKKIENSIATNTELTPKQAWDYLRFLKFTTEGQKARIELPISNLTPLLSFPETFIREEATFLLAASTKDEDIDLLRRLFAEHNPLVLFQTIKGAWRAWPYFQNQAIKDEILSLILSKFENESIILRGIHFLTQFNAGHSSYAFDWRDDIEDAIIPQMWYVWGKVMPLFFKKAPFNISLNHGRFESTMEESAKQLALEDSKLVLFSWMDWTLNLLKAAPWRTNMYDFVFYYFDQLFIQLSDAEKTNCLKQFLETGIRILKAYTVRYFLFKWSHINQEQKNIVQQLWSGDESEIFKDIALTTRNCPSDVLLHITGHPQLLLATMEETVAALGEQRIKRCLCLEFLENDFRYIHLSAHAQWQQVLVYYLSFPDSDIFLLAFRVLAITAFERSQALDAILGEKAERRLSVLIRHSTKITRSYLVHLIIEVLASGAVGNLKYWIEKINEVSSPDEKEEYNRLFTEYIETISYQAELKTIPRDVFNRNIITALPNDLAFLRMMRSLRDETDNDERKNTHAIALDFLETLPVRIWNLIQMIQDWQIQHSDLVSEEDRRRFEKYFDRYADKVNELEQQITAINHKPFLSFFDTQYLHIQLASSENKSETTGPVSSLES